MYAIRSYYDKIKQHNRNKLLWRDNTVDGMKTGHTEAAGYCLVASAQREQMRLISVVMGTKSEKARASASQALLNYGFRFFESHRLYSAGETLNRARIWKGNKPQIALGLAHDLHVSIPHKQYKKLNAQLDVIPTITAPVQQGQEA